MAMPAWQQLRNAGVQGQGSAAANRAAAQQQPQPTPSPSIPMPPAPGGGGPGDIQAAIAAQRAQLGQPGAGGQTPPYVDPSQIHPGLPPAGGPHLMPPNQGGGGGQWDGGGIVNLPGQAPRFGHAGQQLGVGTDPNQMLQHAQGIPPSISMGPHGWNGGGAMGGTMQDPGKLPFTPTRIMPGNPAPGMETKPLSLGGAPGISGAPGQMSAGGLPPAISTMAANPAIQSVVQNLLKGGGANGKGGGVMKPPPSLAGGGGGGVNQPGKVNPLAGQRY